MEIPSKRAERRLRAREDKSVPTQAPVEAAPAPNKLGDFFEKNYKRLMIIPLILLILAIAQIGFQIATTGDFVQKGISLSGGISITLEADTTISADALEQHLSTLLPGEEVSVRSLANSGTRSGLIIESTADTEAQRLILIDGIKQKVPTLTEKDYTQEIIGAALGEQFFKQTITILIVAFILMSIVVFIYFRETTPSIVVISSMISDILITLAIVNVMGIQLSTAGIAAFLMLIGFSVDTDIVLSTKMLKEKGSHSENFLSALKTAMTMIVTTLSAVAITYFFTTSEVIKQIMIIIFIGLIVDMIVTWIQNAGLIRLHLAKKDHGKV